MITVVQWEGPRTYHALLADVWARGQEAAPRGLRVRSLGHTAIEYPTIENVVPVGVGRKLNMRIGAAETAQLIAGVSDLAQLDGVSNGTFSKFSNENKLMGAYGPRLYTAIPRVIDRLHTDPNTRQAHAGIWSNEDLVDPGQRDIPCTIGLTFRRGDDGLHMTTVMRSNDVWLGLPYDTWMFTRLQAAVAYALNIPTASYTHVALDLHLYENNYDAARKAVATAYVETEQPPLLLPETTNEYTPYSRWRSVRRTALQAVVGGERFKKDNVQAGWYAKQLQDTHADRAVCLYCRYMQDIDQLETHMREHTGPEED